MFTSETTVRVRYAETDQMGYVYYGNYATYYEVARIETLRDLGYSYKKMEENGVMLPVLENKSKYIKPGKYDDLLTIKVTIPKMPDVRIIFKYEVFNEAGDLINIGETTLVFVNTKTGKPCKMPDVLHDILIAYYQ
ncbi:acyl-CoA thioesterase [Reichenbachiella versicolor]|uniref:acyl-CoA thioesterase n=1 Tax=Reichenbachiella versicolor TaxID=1821036 RepID=UPI000D6E7890|nr:thioesterase family protein [Reichenbachiella versicolor]